MVYSLRAKMGSLNEIFIQAKNFMDREENRDKTLESFLPEDPRQEVAMIFSKLAIDKDTIVGKQFFDCVQIIKALWTDLEGKIQSNTPREEQYGSLIVLSGQIKELTKDVNAYIANLEKSKEIPDEDNLGSLFSLGAILGAVAITALITQYVSFYSIKV